MTAVPFLAPWLALASALWTMLPLMFPRRRRAGILIALAHLLATAALMRPWTQGWYWRDGAWLLLVFGQGALVSLGRLGFELSPLGARSRTTPADLDGTS
ncbi:hypothetical protein ACFY5C_39830 [Streptomyces sp. NPDC012935]|uniref:hypothetical protein n=1 Tax=Streptomyces sp. NPDC012935 TaxID=3364857 RepID=UPI0036C57331